MEEIRDDLGRGKNFDNVDFDAISSALNSAVGKAVEQASGKMKESSAMDEVVKALSDLGEDIKESLRSSAELVGEVKKAADAMSKVREAPKQARDFSSLESGQAKAMNSILKSQQKAQSAKIATFTAGAGVGARSGSKSASLEDFGFKPRGTDTVPAMLSPGEIIVNKKGARDNRQTLDGINKGYYKGGMVKPTYLAAGTKPMGKPSTLGWIVKKTFGVDLDVGAAAEETAGEAKKYDELGERLAEHLNRGFKDKDRREMAKWLTGMSTMLLGGRADLTQNLFAGAVTDVTNFNREMRSLAFETQGITGSTRDLQAQFADVGTSIKETGKSIDLVQKLYMSNLRKGFRVQKDGLKVVKSGLFLSTMIGSEASQTADMFSDWNRMLGMSADQMSRLAHDTKEIARSTGVTGDELLAAMKSSEGILKNLRNQGNLTSGAAKNVITAMAEAKKLGVEEPAQRILGAMGGTNPLLEADNKTQSFVLQYAGRMGREGTDAAIQGTLLKDKKLLKGFVAEMDTDIALMTGGRAKTVAEIENLSEQERTTLAIAIKAKTGLDLYEFKSMHDVLEMSSKSLADKLNELSLEVADATKTESEKKFAMQQMEDLQMSAGLGFISKLSEQANKKGSGSLATAADKTMAGFKGDEKSDFDLILKSMDDGMKAQINGLAGSQKDFAAMGLVTAKKLKEQGKAEGLTVQDFGPEMLDAISRGDKEKIGEISKNMEDAANRISVYSKASGDPMAKLAFQLSEMNENIRKFFAPLISGVFDLIGSNGLLMGQIGLASAAIYESFGKKIMDRLGFARLFPTIKGKTETVGERSVWKPAASPHEATMRRHGYHRSEVLPAEEISESFSKSFGKTLKEKIPKALNKYFYRPIQKVLNGAATGVERIFNGMADLIDGIFKVKIQNVLTGVFDIIVRAAGRVRAAWTGFYSIVASSLEGIRLGGLVGFRTGLGRALTYLMNIPSRIMSAFRGSSVGKVVENFIGGIRRFFSGFAVVADFGIGRLYTLIGNAWRGGVTGLIRSTGRLFSSGLRGLAGSLTAGWANILFAVVDGAMGAYQGFQNAGKIFDGVIKNNSIGITKLTTGMKASATAGGALAGVVDGLLFGLLSLLGLRGTLEKFFSQFIYAFVVFGQGISEGFMSWMPEISKSMKALGDAFLGLWNSIMTLFGMDPAADMSAAFSQLYAILKPIGHALGWLVGGALRGAIDGITLLVWAMTGLVRIVDGISDVIYYVGQMFYNLGAAILHPVQTVQSMIEGISSCFDWLYEYLFGHSVVPDMCEGIAMVFARMAMNVVSGVASMVGKVAMFFLKLPFRIMGGLASLAGRIAMFFLKLPFRIMGGLFNAFVKWPIKMMYKLMNFMTGGLLGKGLEGMASLAKSFFDSIMNGAKEALKMGYRFMNFISGGWLDKIVNGLVSIGGKIVTLVDDYLTKPIVGAFTYIAEKVAGLLNKIPIPKWLMGGGNTAATAAGGASAAVGATDDVARAASAAGGAAKAVGAADDVAKVASAAAGASTAASITDDVATAAAAAAKPFSGMGGAMGTQAAKTASASASMADDAAKLVLASADDLAQAAPKALGFFGKAGGLVSGLAKKAPIIGPMLDFGIRKATGQSTGKAAVGTSGGLAGGMAGAAIGTMILPGIGTAIGAVIGGIAGGMLADKAYDSVVPPDDIGNEHLLRADEQMITQGDMQLRQGEVMENTLAMGAHPGSMYVHDIHTEALLLLMWNFMKKDGSSSDAYSELERKMKESNELISMLDGTLAPMAERATKKGSIYTHDVHVEKELKDKVGEDKKGASATSANADTALKEATAEIDNKLKSGGISQQAINLTDTDGIMGSKTLSEDLEKSLARVAANNESIMQKQSRISALNGEMMRAQVQGDKEKHKALGEEKSVLESVVSGLKANNAEQAKKIEGEYGEKTVKAFDANGATGFRMLDKSGNEDLKRFHDAKVRAGHEEKLWDTMTEEEKKKRYGIAGVEKDKVDLQKHKRETYDVYVPDEKVIPVEKWTPEMRNENMHRERTKMMQKEAEMHSALTEEQSKALLRERSALSGTRPGGVPTNTGTWSDVTEVSDITTPKLKEAADLPYMETHKEAYAREGKEFADSQKRLKEMTDQRAAAQRKWHEVFSLRSDQAKASLPKDLDEQIKKEQLKSDLIAQRQRSGVSIPSTKSPFEKDENGRIVESNELGLRRERKEMEESQAKLKELQSKKDALGPANKTWGDFFMWRGEDRANKAKDAMPDLERDIFKEEVRSRALKAHQGMGEPMRTKDWTGGDAYSPPMEDLTGEEASFDESRLRKIAEESNIKIGNKFSANLRGNVPVKINGQAVAPEVLQVGELEDAVGAMKIYKEMGNALGPEDEKILQSLDSELSRRKLGGGDIQVNDARSQPAAVDNKDQELLSAYTKFKDMRKYGDKHIPSQDVAEKKLNVLVLEKFASLRDENGDSDKTYANVESYLKKASSTKRNATEVTDEEISSGITRYGSNGNLKDLEKSIAIMIRDSLAEMEMAKKSGSDTALMDAEDKFDVAMTSAVHHNIIRAPKDSEGDEIFSFDSETPEAISAAEKYLDKFIKHAPSGQTAPSGLDTSAIEAQKPSADFGFVSLPDPPDYSVEQILSGFGSGAIAGAEGPAIIQQAEKVLPMLKPDVPAAKAESVLDTSAIEAQGQTQIEKLSAVENMADHATKPGSIFTHDIHTEGLLNSILKDPESATGVVMSMSKQMDESVVGGIDAGQKMIEAIVAEHGSLVYPEIKPMRPEATDARAWKPIAIPEKDPATMARFESIQKEMMKSGLEVPLIPSSTSSLNITDAEREAANAMESVSIAHSTPVGQHAVPILRAEEDADVNGVQPVHLRDITESILRDKVGADAGTNKVQSDELARMEKVANDQYAELQQIKEGIREMVTLLRPSGTNIAGDSEMAAGKTKDPRKPYHASIYGKMKYGQPGGNANRAVVNDGMC